MGAAGAWRSNSDRAEMLSGVRPARRSAVRSRMLIRNRDWENWQRTMRVGREAAPDAVGDASGRRSRGRVRATPTWPAVVKYERDDMRDMLERASARETAARVAAGALARQLLARFGIDVLSHVIAHRRRRAGPGPLTVSLRRDPSRSPSDVAAALRRSGGRAPHDRTRSMPPRRRATRSAAPSKSSRSTCRPGWAATSSGIASSTAGWRRR